MNPEPPSGGLYVHVPFCRSICPYCDFAVTMRHAARQTRFVERILSEIELVGSPSSRYDTLYFGGGTPSALAPGELARVIEALEGRDWLTEECHVFIEVNPEDVDRETLALLRRIGVRTVSLGIQALDEDALRFLGRTHSVAGARRAVENARQAGFDTVSIDLIYGLPEQDAALWKHELREALALEPDHLSCYQLEIHDGTRFGVLKRQGRLAAAAAETQAELFRLTHHVLADAGYEGYEVSNFARSPEHRSRHNQKYWSHAPYLGLGPSAHSFDGSARWWNRRSFFDWGRALDAGISPIESKETLDDESLLLEMLMLRFRTRDGLDADGVRRRFGLDLIESNRELVANLAESGLLELDFPWLRPTVDGLAVADSLARSFNLSLHPCRTPLA